MHMFGVRQALPAPGRLASESAALEQRAGALDAAGAARARDLSSRIRRTYAEYYLAEREYQLHVEHRALADQALELARAVHRAGKGTQQDVLRAMVETTRWHAELTKLEARRRTTRALLNALMARPSEAALGPPRPIDPVRVQLASQRLERSLAQRPEIVAAERSLGASESELDAARTTSRWPSFMLGVQYMYMPPEEEPHNYGVMVSMSLPWLNSAYTDQVRAAEASVAAERAALSNTRNTARYELYAALEQVAAARRSLEIVERTLVPQVTLSLEAARAAYRGGNPDSRDLFEALRVLLDAKLERERLLSELESALAEVERASGQPLSPSIQGAP
jgi:outer membrane protein TolC